MTLTQRPNARAGGADEDETKTNGTPQSSGGGRPTLEGPPPPVPTMRRVLSTTAATGLLALQAAGKAVQNAPRVAAEALLSGGNEPREYVYRASPRSDGSSGSFDAGTCGGGDDPSGGYHEEARAAQAKEKEKENAKRGWAGMRKLGVAVVVLLVLGLLYWCFQFTALGNTGYWLLQRSSTMQHWWAPKWLSVPTGSIVQATLAVLAVYAIISMEEWYRLRSGRRGWVALGAVSTVLVAAVAGAESSGHVFLQLANKTGTWSPPLGCDVPTPGTRIKKDALQNISSCFRDAFNEHQRFLNATLSDVFSPAVQHAQAARCQWTGVIALICLVVWCTFKLQLLPGQELLPGLWNREWTATKWKLRPPPFVFVFFAVLALRLTAPGLALYLYIQGVCDQLEQKQGDFIRDLQTAAVITLYKPEFKCLLLRRNPIPRLINTLLKDKFWQGLLVWPAWKFLTGAYEKAANAWQASRALAKGESELVNFSLNMIQPRAGMAHDEPQGDKTHTLKWRTLCEIRKDDLIPNAELRRKVTEAAAYTTSDDHHGFGGAADDDDHYKPPYPFLHTLHPKDSNGIAALNLLLLNRISQLVGAYQYFGMNEAENVRLSDYCFGMTCENYAQGTRHENKLRVMIVKKSVLLGIAAGQEITHVQDDARCKDEPAGILAGKSDKNPFGFVDVEHGLGGVISGAEFKEGAQADRRYSKSPRANAMRGAQEGSDIVLHATKRLRFEVDPVKGGDRWRTLQAMGQCLSDGSDGGGCVSDFANCVGTMQVPFFAFA